MGARWVSYASAPIAVVVWALGVIIAAVLLLGGSAMERGSVHEEQDFYAVSFINTSSICEPEDGRAWLLIRIEATGRPFSVRWTMTSDANPAFVRGRTAEVRPGTPKRLSRKMPIDETGETTIRFSTSDGEHDLVTRCTPDDPL